MNRMKKQHRKRAQRVESSEPGRGSAWGQQKPLSSDFSGDTFRMSQLSCFKGFGVISGLVHPHAIDDAYPDITQGTQSHTMGLAFSLLALIVIKSPPFLHGRLPGELVENVPQRFQAGQAFVRFGIITTLEWDWCRPGQ